MFAKWYTHLHQLGQVKVGQLYSHSVLYLLCNVSVLERDLKYDLLMNSRATQNLKLVTPALSAQKKSCNIYEFLNVPYGPQRVVTVNFSRILIY